MARFAGVALVVAIVGCSSATSRLRDEADVQVDVIRDVLGADNVDRSSFDRRPIKCGGGEESIVVRTFSADAPAPVRRTLSALVEHYRDERASLRQFQRSGTGQSLSALSGDGRLHVFLTITGPPTRIWGQVWVSTCALDFLMKAMPGDADEVPVGS